jgi:hypothetical protein
MLSELDIDEEHNLTALNMSKLEKNVLQWDQ